MAIVKGKKTTKPSEEVVELNTSMTETITVKIRKGTEYSKESIEVGRSLSLSEGDDPNEKINELIGELDSVASEYISQFLADGSFEEETEVETSEEQIEEEVDEDAIRAMGKRDLVKFIKENDVDIDPKEYKSISDLQDAVVELLFGEGTSDDTSDDAEEAVSEEDIRAMDKKEIVAFIKENDIDVDPTEYKKLSSLQDAVIEAISEADGEETDDDTVDGEEVDEDAIRAMDKAELVAFIKENDLGVNPKEYKKLADLQEAVIEQMSEAGEELTSEQVMEMSKEELVELIKENDLDINPKKFKKTSELAEAVVEALFSEEGGFGDFDDTDFQDE